MRCTARLIYSFALVVLMLLTGCNQRSGSSIGNRVGVALTVNGGSAPTAQQTQLIIASIRPELERQGFIVVTDFNQADRIIRVDFTPDEFFPEIAGNAVVLGWRVNPATYGGYGSGNYSYQPFINAYYASNYGYDRYNYDYTRYDSRGDHSSSAPPYQNSKNPNDGSSTRPEDRNRDHARRDGDRDGDKSDHRRDGDKGDRNGERGRDRDGDGNRGDDHRRDNRPPGSYDRPQPTYAGGSSNAGYSSNSGYSSSNSPSYSSSSSSSGSTASSSYSSGGSSYSSSSSSSYSPPSSSSSSPSTPTVSHQNE